MMKSHLLALVLSIVWLGIVIFIAVTEKKAPIIIVCDFWRGKKGHDRRAGPVAL